MLKIDTNLHLCNPDLSNGRLSVERRGKFWRDGGGGRGGEVIGTALERAARSLTRLRDGLRNKLEI